MKNKYPVFIPTKGRHDRPMTIGVLKKMGVDFKIVIEKQEFYDYRKVVGEEQILVLPHQNEGVTKTRNWIWDYAEKMGYEKYWTFDDNIVGIYRFNNNKQIKVADPTVLRVIEEFSDRYTNLPICGMQYHGFCVARDKHPPFVTNTRVYSNMLIETKAKLKNGEKLRNKLFFNEDTDLCLQVLKDGQCTVLFNAFLIDKTQTMLIKGGNTHYYDQTDKRKQFAEELQKAHPDCVEVVWKFNRWHHNVDYSRFSKNKLKFKEGINLKDEINDYGMKLVEIK